MKQLAVLVSGEGTILQEIVADDIPIAAVVADRECPALEFARKQKLKVYVIGNTDKEVTLTRALIAILKNEKIELVMAAGFMSILNRAIFCEFPHPIIGTHPSLLPAFPGPKAVEDALKYGVKISGCTVFRLTARIDAGEIIAQRHVRVQDGDTVESLHRRIKVEEWNLVPQVLRKIMDLPYD